MTNTANAINESRQALQVWQIAGDRVGLTGEKVSDILRSVTERLVSSLPMAAAKLPM